MQETAEGHPQGSGLSPYAVYGYTTKTGQTDAGARFFNVVSATHHPASSGRGAKGLENNRANSVPGEADNTS